MITPVYIHGRTHSLAHLLALAYQPSPPAVSSASSLQDELLVVTVWVPLSLARPLSHRRLNPSSFVDPAVERRKKRSDAFKYGRRTLSPAF